MSIIGWEARGSKSMSDKVQCEIFVAMNEDGDWVVVAEESEALEKLAGDVGGYQARVVKVTVKMAPPVLSETEVEVPDEAGKTTEQVEAEVAA
jgi:hypothetical protein